MSELLKPDTFEFFAKYLLAGFVFLSARSWLVAGERPKPNETLIEALILSLLNQTISLVTFMWVTADLAANYSVQLLLAQVVIQPLVLGLAVGGLVQANWFPAGLRRLFLPVIRPVNQAFDHAFESMPAPSFLIITFNEGQIVYGYFGPNSLAGTDEESGGLYLERIYDVADDGTWKEAQPRRSVWITLSDVRSIEFIPAEENGNAKDTL